MTSGLAFLPGCAGDAPLDTSSDDTGGDPTTVTASATDDSGTGEDTNDSTSDGNDDVATNAESSSDESSESGDPQCGGAGTCGAVPPVGWFGPVVYASVPPGDAPPGCPDTLEAGPTVLDGFADPGPAVCSCECELSMPASCTSCLETSNTNNCGGGGYYYYGCYGGTTVTEACTNITIPGFLQFTSTEQYMYGGGGGGVCEETEEELIPPFQWAATIATCRVPETALVCDEGVCIPPAPEGFEAKWCMYQTGDLECPAGPYSVKTLFWSDVEDTRSCTNCGCGAAAESCEQAELLVFDDPDCAGIPNAIISPSNACVAATGSSIAGDFGNEDACAVAEVSMPQGSIAPVGAFTFCCNE